MIVVDALQHAGFEPTAQQARAAIRSGPGYLGAELQGTP
jgi:hypothetical protein